MKHKIGIANVQGWQYELGRGLPEGCILSPALFSVFFNGVIKAVRDCDSGIQQLNDSGEEFKLDCLLYADDLVLCSPSPEGLQKLAETN